MRIKLLTGALLLMPGLLFAAGLGKLKTKSALGEPLRAEIEILESYPDEIETVVARLANPEEYAVAGLSEVMPNIGIRCTVFRRNAGSPILIVRSDKPVTDAFLELLIKLESRKANVDLIRQYTVLLEPPANTGKSEVSAVTDITPVASAGSTGESVTDSAPVSEPSAGKHKRQKKQATTETSGLAIADGASQIVKHPKKTIQASGETYLTQSGDIFGKVAQKYQPAGVPLKKVMSVMFKLNPDAFEHGKMRKLKAGVVLQIPTLASMGVQTPVAGADASMPPAAPAPSVSTQTTVAPQQAATAPVPQPQPTVAPTAAAATVAASTAQNMSPKPAQTVSPAEQPSNVTPLASGEATTASAGFAPGNPSDEQQADAPRAVASPVTVTMPKLGDAPKDTGADQSERGLLWRMILMLTLTVSLCVAVALRFFKKHTHREVYVFEETAAVQDEHAAEVAVEAEAEHAHEVEDDEKSAIAKSQEIQIHDVDPVVEADVLMSYGHDEKAEGILNQALKSAPQKPEISLALLKVYAKRENKAAFAFLASKLQARVQSGEEEPVLWDKVVALGQSIDPENPLYQSAQTVAPAEISPVVDTATTPAASAVHSQDDNSIDFTLDHTPAPQPETLVQAPLTFELDTPAKAADTPLHTPDTDDISLDKPADAPSEDALATQAHGMVVEHVDADFESAEIETIVIESVPKRRKSAKLS